MTTFEAMNAPLRLLWVKAGKLLPVDTGGKLRSYHLARALAARHQLTMLTYYAGPEDGVYERAMSVEFPGAISLRYGPARANALSDVLRYAGNTLAAAPFAVAKFTANSVRAAVAERMQGGRYDAVICDFLSASLNFPERLPAPTLLFQHNVESALWKRQATHERNLVRRAAYALESMKMDRYEARTVGRFHHIVAVSDHDKRLMSAWVDPSRISVVPTGVDAARFRAARDIPQAAADVVFLGSMDWEANIDGAEWFVSEVWPAIRQAVPDARLRLVGRSPHARVLKLAGDDIEVTGTVPSVLEYLGAATCVIVPLRIGGGTRLKIYEAMAAARPVVSTSVGAEGLDYTDGTDILIGDTPADFASCVIAVLQDASLRRRIGDAAAVLAERHDWSQVSEQFVDAVRRAIAEHQPLAGAAPALERV